VTVFSLKHSVEKVTIIAMYCNLKPEDIAPVVLVFNYNQAYNNAPEYQHFQHSRAMYS